MTNADEPKQSDPLFIKKLTLACVAVLSVASMGMAALSIHADGSVQPACALAAILGAILANVVVNLGRMIL